jgi:hypothetical protein
MISLGIIPDWQFSPDPTVNYNLNRNLVMPEGVMQTTVQPLNPTVFGTFGPGTSDRRGLAGLGITMVDPPLKRFVSSLGGGTVWGSDRKIGWKHPPGLRPYPALAGVFPDTWGWVPKLGIVAALGTGAWFLAKHLGGKKKRRR